MSTVPHPSDDSDQRTAEIEAHEAGGDLPTTTRAFEPYLYRKRPIARRLLRELGLELTPEREAVVVRAFETIRKRR